MEFYIFNFRKQALHALAKHTAVCLIQCQQLFLVVFSSFYQMKNETINFLNVKFVVFG